MASKYWIKLYHEILDDPKMGRLPDHLWRRSVETFLLAGEYDHGGYLPPVGDMAWKLRSTEQEIEECLQALAAIDITRKDENGWCVIHFAERQDADSNAERQERYRKSRRHGNDKSNDPLQNRNADIDIDIDKELDVTKESLSSGVLAPLSEAFDKFSGLPTFSPNPKEYITGLERLHKAGILPCDIEQAFRTIKASSKKYTIIGPNSIYNFAATAMGERKTGGSGRRSGRLGPEV